jgi:hypothetical protein
MARISATVHKAEVPAEIFVARSSGVIKVNGVIHRYIRGLTRVPAGHALLKAIPDKFEPMRLEG